MSRLKRDYLKQGDKILQGRYEVLKVIHTSGMSNVYLVMDSNLNKQWCLKEIRKSESGRDKIEYEALIQEASIMKGLNHPNIPRITTIEEEGDSIFIIMDYIDGISLKSYVIKNGRLNQDLVVNWMTQITQVMSYLHNRRNPILYRDMKPENIMVRSNGDISLIDFGISVVIKEPGQLISKSLGTKGYAPDEMRKGKICDLRSDIYAMGKTMYFMLSGINPAQVPKDKLRPIRELSPGLSTGVELIVNKCTQEDVNKRYQSCEELLYDLQNFRLYDSKHIRGVKLKVGVTFGMFILGLSLIGGSFIPKKMYENKQNVEYNNLVMAAEQSGKPEDFEKVFDLRSNTSISIYKEYVDSLKVDGVFSTDEESRLMNYINPNLDLLKESSDYGSLAYEIGKLYWFYYEGSTDNEGIIASVKWFKDAKDTNYQAEVSDVYYQLGLFNRDILSSIAESEDSGMYANYWSNLIKAKGVDTGDIITLQLNLCIARCIESYGYNLKSEGISKEDVLKQISELNKFISDYSPNTDVSREKYNKLESCLTGLSEKVNSLYSKGGEN